MPRLVCFELFNAILKAGTSAGLIIRSDQSDILAKPFFINSTAMLPFGCKIEPTPHTPDLSVPYSVISNSRCKIRNSANVRASSAKSSDCEGGVARGLPTRGLLTPANNNVKLPYWSSPIAGSIT